MLLALTWGELRESRVHIESQDRKITALFKATRPALDEVPGIVDEAQPLLRQAAPVLADVLAAGKSVDDVASRLPLILAGVQGLANEGIPLARGLSESDLPGLVAALGASDLPGLVSALGASDLPALVTDLRASDVPALVASLRESDIPAAVESTSDLVSGLMSGDRLTGALDVTTAVLSEVAARRLPKRAESSSRRLKDLLRVQRDTIDILSDSLSIQQEILDRVRSIDNKFGGQLPPTLGGG